MTAPGWLDELDLHVGAPDAAMGTRSLGLDRWFLVDDEWEAQRAEAARLVAEHRDEVVVGVDDPAVLEPSAELLDVVSHHLADGSGLPIPAHAGESVGQNGGGVGEHPLVAVRLLVADDLCVLLPSANGWRLAAGCVCFPSYWRPRDRVGGPLAGVHAAVPGYPGPLAGRVDGFLGRLRPGQGVWRRNWLVHDVADLHVPRWVPDVDRPTPVPDGRWLRSERQTLVRLPETEAVVFGIRTQQVPMAALAGRPDVAGGLAAAIRGWSPEQRAYKGAAVDDALLAWLDQAGCA